MAQVLFHPVQIGEGVDSHRFDCVTSKKGSDLCSPMEPGYEGQKISLLRYGAFCRLTRKIAEAFEISLAGKGKKSDIAFPNFRQAVAFALVQNVDNTASIIPNDMDVR